MLEGFQIIQLDSATAEPRVILHRGSAVINKAGIKVINEHNYFDIGINTKTKQLCLSGTRIKSKHSLPCDVKNTKNITNKRFIDMISRFVKGYDEDVKFNIPTKVVDNSLVLSMSEATQEDK